MEWDVKDPTHRRVLETARAWGVSPSRFLGAEPRVVVHRTDIGGFIHVHEAEWTVEDREAALALQDYEASLCSGCGQPLEETTKPEREYAYKAQLPIRCHYCTAASRGQAEYDDSEHSHALHFPVKLRSSEEP